MTYLKRILLVEDDPNDLELALEGLSDYNLLNKIVVARDGQEALDYLYRQGSFAQCRDGNPIVILLDIKMPKVDGLSLLKRIRSDENLRMIPVVILTSSNEERDVIESYRLGVNAYVVKPVEFHSFVDAVKQIGAFWAVVNEPPPEKINHG